MRVKRAFLFTGSILFYIVLFVMVFLSVKYFMDLVGGKIGRLFIGTAFLFFMLPSFAQANPIFNNLEWQNRVLVITGPQGSVNYAEQYDLLYAEREALEDRDIIVLHFHGDVIKNIQDLSPYFYNAIYLENSKKIRYFESRLNTDESVFSIVLVGLDGEFKEIWRDVTDPGDIFELIDAMPMRQ